MPLAPAPSLKLTALLLGGLLLAAALLFADGCHQVSATLIAAQALLGAGVTWSARRQRAG